MKNFKWYLFKFICWTCYAYVMTCVMYCSAQLTGNYFPFLVIAAILGNELKHIERD